MTERADRTRSAGFTLIETMFFVAIGAFLLMIIMNIWMTAGRRWGANASYGLVTQSANTTLERVAQDIQYAQNLSVDPQGANSAVYDLRLAALSGGAPAPTALNGTLWYPAGNYVRYYLSDLTASVTVSGGTILYRATSTDGVTYTKDSAWRPVGGISGFTLSLPQLNLLTAAITAQETQNNTSTASTVTRTYSLAYSNCTIVRVDSLASYLQAEGQNPPDAPTTPVPISLAALGILPGSTVSLQFLGQWCCDDSNTYAWLDYSPSVPNSFDLYYGAGGVFSSSNLIGATNTLNRIPGAVSCGLNDLSTPPTYFSNTPTDISQDFNIPHTGDAPSSVTVTVPAGAQYLFVAVVDCYYSDNSDADGTLSVIVCKRT